MSESQYDRLDDLRDWDRRHENIVSERRRYNESDVRNTAQALRELSDSSAARPPAPLDPEDARALLLERILIEIPNDSVLFHHIDATFIEHMRSVYEAPNLLHSFRASTLLAWAIAGADEALPRARACAHPEASLLAARLVMMKLMQQDLLDLDHAVVRKRMRGD